MKALLIILSLFVVHTATVHALSPDGIPPEDPHKADLLRSNIAKSLGHDIEQIRINTVQLIIDIKSRFPDFDLDNTVIPLMHILKTADREEFRILAAVALYHVRTETGRFAVSRRATYDGSDRVRRQCSRLSTRWDDWESDGPQLTDGRN